MDRFDARILATWIRDNLEGCLNPRALGKGLTAIPSGEWRFSALFSKPTILEHLVSRCGSALTKSLDKSADVIN